MLKPIEALPGHSRVWVFGANRPIEEADVTALLREVDEFLETWNAHGEPLSAGRQWVDDRFLVVAADQSLVNPSGCSIDALVGVLKAFQARTGTELLGNGSVWYRDGDEVVCATRPTFRTLVSEGAVTDRSTVYDTTVTRLDDVRDGTWVGPAADLWHGGIFF